MTRSVVAAVNPAATVDIDLSRYRLGWGDDEDYVFKPNACPTCGEGHPPPMEPCFNEIGAH